MNGAEQLKSYANAGFTQEELGGWAAQKTKELSDAGFGMGEISTYFGAPPFDPKPIVDHIHANLEAATNPETAGGPRKPVTDFLDAFQQGFGMSSASLLVKPPTMDLAPDAPRLSRIASQVGTLVGDIPAMMGGYLVGGANPVTGTAGAFALPAGLRKIMMDKYEKGEVTSSADFWDRASGAVVDTLKNWVTGAATGVVGKAIGLAPVMMSASARNAATVAGELTTMVTVGKALEGHLPEPDDFIDTALALGFIKGSTMIAGKLRTIYATTGVRPDQLAMDAQKNPTIMQDLASNRTIPKVYEDALAADTLARLRHAEGKSPTPQFTGTFVEKALTPPSITELAKAQQYSVPKSSETGAFYEPGQPPVARVVPPYEARPAPMPSAKDLVSGKAALDMQRQEQTSVFEKPRALRTAEELIQERNHGVVRLGEELIKQGEKPSLRESRYFPPKQRETSEDTIGGDLARALRDEGIPFGKYKKLKIEFGEDAPPKWQTDLAKESPEQQVAARISIGEQPKEKMTWQRLYTMAVDELNPIREKVKEAGDKLTTATDPYRLARLSRGSFGKSAHFLEDGTFDFTTYKNTGPGLAKIVAPVKTEMDALRINLVSKRAIELAERGIESGIDPVVAKEAIKGQSVKFNPVNKQLVQYQNETLRYMLDAGLLTPKVYDAMVEANKFYVPFYRVLGPEAQGGSGAGPGLTTKNPIHKIIGSERMIVDPLESIIKNTYTYIALAERNAVGQAYVKMAQESGHPEQYLKRVTPVAKSQLTQEQIAQFLKESGGKESAEVVKTIAELTSPLPDNHIAVYEAGKRIVYEVDADIAAAFKATDAESANLLLKIASIPAKTLRAGAITSPDFIARNLIRDQLSAFLLSKGGYVPIFDFVRGAMSLIKKDADYGNWLKSGGANAAMVSVDRQYMQEHLFHLSKETGLLDKAINAVKSPYEMLRIASELTENATRLGEFKRVAGTNTSKAALQEAGYASREVTLDFARIGSKMRAVNMIDAFSNVAIQGVDRVIRGFGENPGMMSLKIAGAITVPSILLWITNHDDPRYQEIPNWQKDLFWIVMTEDHIYRIPKPFELGVIFGSLPERSLDAYFADKPDAFRDFTHSVLDAFLPSLTPNVAAPIVEQFSNRSIFTGTPIIPSHLEKLLPEYQYTEYTTETAKAIGGLIGAFPGMEATAVKDETFLGGMARALTTPTLIENYVRSWTGGLGMYALQIVDKSLREAGVVPDPVLPASTLADLPVIKAFMVRYPSATAQSIQEFYNNYYVSKKYFDTMMDLVKQGDARATQLIDSHQEDLAQLDGIRETLTQQSQLVRMIHKDPTMTPTDKRQLIDTLYFSMIELAQGGNTMLRSLSIATKEPHL